MNEDGTWEENTTSDIPLIMLMQELYDEYYAREPEDRVALITGVRGVMGND